MSTMLFKLLVFILCLFAVCANPHYMRLFKGATLIYTVNIEVALDSTSATGKKGNFKGNLHLHVERHSGSSENAVFFMNARVWIDDPETVKHVGSPFTFCWRATGEISQIVFDAKEATNHKHIKLAILNALGTKLLPNNQAIRVEEASTLGHHYSNYKGSSRSFNHHDVISFTDSTLDPAFVTLVGQGSSFLSSANSISNSRFNIEVHWRPARVSGMLGDGDDAVMRSTGKVLLQLHRQRASDHTIIYEDATALEGFTGQNCDDSLLFELTVPTLENSITHPDLFHAASAYLHVPEDDIDAVEVAAPLELISSLVEASHDLNIDKLQRVARSARDSYLHYPSVFDDIADLADPSNIQLTQAVCFVLSAEVHGSSALIRLLHSNSQAVSFLCSKSAIFATSSVVQNALTHRALLPDYVGLSLRKSISHLYVPSLSKALNFNKEWQYVKGIGGTLAGFHMGIYTGVGSNLDCKNPNPTFDYKAYARADVDVSLFGRSKHALVAIAEYGKVSGVPLANQLHLEVFGQRIYHRDFPAAQIDCSDHKIPIAHLAKGGGFKHTVYIIVPVTIEAGINFKLNLDWHWSICDSTLAAIIKTVPTAELSFYGEASVRLFIVKAGARLSAGFDFSLIPEAFIHGTECRAGFNVKTMHNPLFIDLNIFLFHRHCTAHFSKLKVKCRWKEAAKKSLFHWSLPAKEHLVHEQSWKIQ
ncbi:hypothetical protein P9112_012492 [Eukaryota sp. TZLM1-RC]